MVITMAMRQFLLPRILFVVVSHQVPSHATFGCAYSYSSIAEKNGIKKTTLSTIKDRCMWQFKNKFAILKRSA